MSKFVEGIFTIEDEKRNYGILLNKVTNEFKIVLREDALKLDKWCERIKLKEYTIEELKILENYFSKIFDMENNKLKLSEKNINNTNEIIEVRLMVQLACNLKCKYCYANEGTYGHNDKMVMTETDSFNIFMKLMEIGVNKIQHISFFGGEPNVYDKTIIATLDHIQSLYNNKKLIETC